jgi:hypothetical protein
MKSKLAASAMVTLIAGSMAFASSAFAQATAEGNGRTVLIQHAPSTDTPRSTTPPNSAAVGMTANKASPYGSVARPANDQSAISPQEVAAQDPPRGFESKARGENNGARAIRAIGMPETPPCFRAKHYYSASVVNSVPSSCFLGNSGPAPLGGAL